MLAALRASFSAARHASRALSPAPTTWVGAATRARVFASKAPSDVVTPPHPSETFLSGTSSAVLDEYYERWEQDPSSVHSSWHSFFQHVAAGTPPGQTGLAASAAAAAAGASGVAAGGVSAEDLAQHLMVWRFIRAYRIRGHLRANIDPLVNEIPEIGRTCSELDLETYGLSEAHMDKQFFVGDVLPDSPPVMSLRDIKKCLLDTYCTTSGLEYMHITNSDEKAWLKRRFEGLDKKLSAEQKKKVFGWITEADMFEGFLANKFATAKRFGLEGGESMVPGLEALLDTSSKLGVESVVLGMPHRGRLNVIGNVMKKPFRDVLAGFSKAAGLDQDDMIGTGDVKYHLGTSVDRKYGDNTVHLSLTANPSHLEAVNPVVLGKTRAKQFYMGDTNREKVMSVLIHGDAAFIGQGVVAECMELANLKDYTTGGTVHIVVNNQIGFTTDPKFSRSSVYCSDVAKIVGAPIFHVNGDDPEEVVRVCEAAAEFRQKFKRDIVIDIICYRRHGHNELDQPMFTQPLMYKKIAKHPRTAELYEKALLAEGDVSKAELDAIKKSCEEHLETEFEASKTFRSKAADWVGTQWEDIVTPGTCANPRDTNIDAGMVADIGSTLTTVPDGFTVHRNLARILKGKAAMFASGEKFDWAAGEALAFGSLLLEGQHVRLSGQDVERGTFSHRHAVWHDQETAARYSPLAHLAEGQGHFSVSNSNLSEFAVLGFEHGYSLENPKSMVMWEAQFGDFANGAQVMIDTFIAAGEAKWNRQCGTTMLLPHGYEGQGPEHSSARLERFLQLCDEHPHKGDSPRSVQETNLQIANCTTPANYFHLLRRQLHRDFRKPLCHMSPKSLLRHPMATSSLSDFVDTQRFQPVLAETEPGLAADKKIRRVVFCSGKVYYDIVQERAAQKINDVAVVRVEQIAPYPFAQIGEQLERYPNAEIVWAQEEPMNNGAWFWMEPRLRFSSDNARKVSFVGREPSASPATGFASIHAQQQAKLCHDALNEA